MPGLRIAAVLLVTLTPALAVEPIDYDAVARDARRTLDRLVPGEKGSLSASQVACGASVSGGTGQPLLSNAISLPAASKSCTEPTAMGLVPTFVTSQVIPLAVRPLVTTSAVVSVPAPAVVLSRTAAARSSILEVVMVSPFACFVVAGPLP